MQSSIHESPARAFLTGVAHALVAVVAVFLLSSWSRASRNAPVRQVPCAIEGRIGTDSTAACAEGQSRPWRLRNSSSVPTQRQCATSALIGNGTLQISHVFDQERIANVLMLRPRAGSTAGTGAQVQVHATVFVLDAELNRVELTSAVTRLLVPVAGTAEVAYPAGVELEISLLNVYAADAHEFEVEIAISSDGRSSPAPLCRFSWALPQFLQKASRESHLERYGRPNLIRNGGFELAGKASADPAKAPSAKDDARGWNRFYNGGYRRVCGAIPLPRAVRFTDSNSRGVTANQADPTSENSLDSSMFFMPRTGRCAILLGRFGVYVHEVDDTAARVASEDVAELAPDGASIELKEPQHVAPQDVFRLRTAKTFDDVFYGAHQAVRLTDQGMDPHDLYMFSLHMAVIELDVDPINLAFINESVSVQFSVLYSTGEIVERISVPLIKGACSVLEQTWLHSCVELDLSHPLLGRPQWIHVFLHVYHHYGVVLMDDIKLIPFSGEATAHQDHVCHRVDVKQMYPAQARFRSEKTRGNSASARLEADVPAASDQLTLAVALSADRISRLVRVAELYPDSPISAAVHVNSEEDVALVLQHWRAHAALHRHVNLTIAYEKAYAKRGAFPINLLRNVALENVHTEFVSLIDVDLLPSSDHFRCLGPVLAEMLSPPEGKGDNQTVRALVLPVFMVDVGVAVPRHKDELVQLLHAEKSCPYCIVSQKGTKFERWYAAWEAQELRITDQYEPYVIMRTRDFFPFDERFVGYGFNKVQWVWAAARAGKRLRLYQLPDTWLVHMNHIEADWVQDIDNAQYLATWRRFLAFMTEEEQAHIQPLLLQKCVAHSTHKMYLCKPLLPFLAAQTTSECET
ncbi:Glycosyltransferase-like protein gnt14 [Porphyridium purpureum]|uniref:Glycosyltransferase-like protein gnt14 n=1 Tax=Porphyridium purpureum TaxID=35688 RepID=A0A5J4YS52_PORPP|nr:Glycosyltransferase-like protein gnt14 [Porphyridium purpureum]|eukprot:POR2443..scf229_5